MKDLLILLAHLLTTIAKLMGPCGARAFVADSLLLKQQLLVAVSRSKTYSASCSDNSAIDAFEFSRPAQEAQIPAAVLISEKRKARP